MKPSGIKVFFVTFVPEVSDVSLYFLLLICCYCINWEIRKSLDNISQDILVVHET